MGLSWDFGLIERERWLQALSIDLQTGLDPAGFKVRAAQGLDAAVGLSHYEANMADLQSEFIQGRQS